jgi:hypothetical protein
MKVVDNKLLLFVVVVPWLLVHKNGVLSKEVDNLPHFYHDQFLESVDKSLNVVRSLLEMTRHPQMLGDDDAEQHTWTDKYSVAEMVTHTAIAAVWNALERMLSISPDDLETLQQWVHTDEQSVMLRFEAHDSFVFQKEVIADIDLGKTEDEGLWESLSRVKVVTKRTEYHWKAAIEYKIVVCRGSCDSGDSNTVLTLMDRKRSATIITLNKNNAPFPELTIQDPLDLNLTWLVRMTKLKQQRVSISRFAIDRERTSCRTPSRNPDIREAVDFQRALADWTYGINNYFIYRVQAIVQTDTPAKPSERASLRRAAAWTIFNPILPLMENSAVVSDDTVQLFLEE